MHLGPNCSRNAYKSRIATVEASLPSCMARRNSSRSHGGALEHSSSNSNLPFPRLGTRTLQSSSICFSSKNVMKRFQRAGHFPLVHGPGRHYMFFLTTVLPLCPKRQCGRSASFLFCVKLIYIVGVASLCDMVGMCTGTSFAFCSPDLPPRFFLLEFFFSFFLMSHLIQYPGYHGI